MGGILGVCLWCCGDPLPLEMRVCRTCFFGFDAEKREEILLREEGCLERFVGDWPETKAVLRELISELREGE